MMGRAKPRLPGKQYTIAPELLEAGSWVLSKDENGKTTWVKEWQAVHGEEYTGNTKPMVLIATTGVLHCMLFFINFYLSK